MTRWIMLALGLIGWALVFTTGSGVLLALGLLVGVVGVLGFILSIAAARVAATSRPDTAMATSEDLLALSRRAVKTPRDEPPES